MLEVASQGIACDFGASQQLWNVPSWVCSIAACGWVYTLRCYTPTMRRSNAPAMPQNRCIFQHVGNFAPDFGISQACIVRFSNGFLHDNKHLISVLVMCELNFLVEFSHYHRSDKHRRRILKHCIVGCTLATLLRFLRRNLR